MFVVQAALSLPRSNRSIVVVPGRQTALGLAVQVPPSDCQELHELPFQPLCHRPLSVPRT